MPEIGILVVTHLGIDVRCQVKAVGHRIKALGHLQGLFKTPVFPCIIAVDRFAKHIIVAIGLFHLFTLSIRLVEVVFRVVRVSIGKADVTPGRQLMLHDDARLGQCLMGTIQHLIQPFGVDIYLGQAQIRCCCTLVWKVAVLIVDSLIKTFLGLVVSSQVSLHRCHSIG